MMTTRTTNLLLVAVVALLTSLIVNVGAQLPGVSVIGAVMPGNCTKFASTLQLQDAGTTCGPNVGTGASLVGSIGNLAGTTSTTYVMLGGGSSCQITPTTSGRLFILVTGDATNTVANDYVVFALQMGTGTAPVNGAAVPGGSFGVPGGISVAVMGAAGGSYRFTIPTQGVITNLTIGTTYWIDLKQEVNAGTGTIFNVICAAFEF